MEALFVYGKLRFSRIQKEVVGRAVKGVPDVLVGYRKSRVMIERDTYPIIIGDKNHSVRGFVLQVSKRELKILDEYESEAYERKKVRLKSGRVAWVYRRPTR